ncbi:chaplin family protein [Streptomyces sp. HUAS TT7]|uniref:chaplin n=1 Tax=Streptomyces sp. HUAS TT7 TaxID=3447507 RepID=UPI003F656B8D
MRQVTRKGLITMAAASGVIAMASGAAHADSAAQGSATNSPGVLSGNTVQVPVHVPVNACGNTVNVIGALNPAFANSCANKGGGHPGGGAVASGHTGNSPGVASGNTIQAPIDAPVNLCGNSVNVVGVGNPAFGNDCANKGGGHPGGGAVASGHTGNSPGVASGNTIQAPIDAPVNLCGNSVNVVGVGNPAFGNDCVNGESGRPGQPQHPGHPGHPQHPGQPHHPGEPHHPGTPHEPGQHKPCPPEQPGHPQQPGHPGVPQHPVSPIAHQPAKPGQPAAPAKPAAPVTQTVTAPKAPAASLAHTGSEGMGFAAPAAAGLVLGGAVLYRRGRAAQR